MQSRTTPPLIMTGITNRKLNLHISKNVTKSRHYYLLKGGIYCKAVVLDCIDTYK